MADHPDRFKEPARFWFEWSIMTGIIAALGLFMLGPHIAQVRIALGCAGMAFLVARICGIPWWREKFGDAYDLAAFAYLVSCFVSMIMLG